MAEDAKADELIEQVRRSFTDTIRRSLAELPAHKALQLGDALCGSLLEELAGMRVTFKARRAVDPDEIAESWRRGLSIAEVVQKHKVSRFTAYKYHPSKVDRQAKAG